MAVEVTWLVRMKGYPYYWSDIPRIGRCFSSLEYANRWPRKTDAFAMVRWLRETSQTVPLVVVKRTKRSGKDLAEHRELQPLLKACNEAEARCRDAHREAEEAKNLYAKALSDLWVAQMRPTVAGMVKLINAPT